MPPTWDTWAHKSDGSPQGLCSGHVAADIKHKSGTRCVKRWQMQPLKRHGEARGRRWGRVCGTGLSAVGPSPRSPTLAPAARWDRSRRGPPERPGRVSLRPACLPHRPQPPRVRREQVRGQARATRPRAPRLPGRSAVNAGRPGFRSRKERGARGQPEGQGARCVDQTRNGAGAGKAEAGHEHVTGRQRARRWDCTDASFPGAFGPVIRVHISRSFLKKPTNRT